MRVIHGPKLARSENLTVGWAILPVTRFSGELKTRSASEDTSTAHRRLRVLLRLRVAVDAGESCFHTLDSREMRSRPVN